MRPTKKLPLSLLCGALIAVLILQAWPATAQSYDPEEELPTPSVVERSLTKLGRGFHNLVLGWTEVPLTVDRKLKEGKPLSYLLSAAPVLGVARGVMRMSVGVYEMVTFPGEGPRGNYEPVIEPAFVF